MATVSMTEGARLVGRSKGTLSKAIKSGRMSYVSKGDGGYQIDVSELTRVFPMPATATPNETPSRSLTPETPPRDDTEERILRAELELVRQQLADVREDRDAWRDQAQRLLLEHKPAEEPQVEQPAETPSRSPSRLFGWLRRSE